MRIIVACAQMERANRVIVTARSLEHSDVELCTNPTEATCCLAGGGYDLLLADSAILRALDSDLFANLGIVVQLDGEHSVITGPAIVEVLDLDQLDDAALLRCLQLCVSRRQELDLGRNLTEAVPAMLFVLDTAGQIVSLNRFAAEKLSYRGSDLIGHSFSAICLDMDTNDLRMYLGRILAADEMVVRVDSTLLTREHLPLCVEQTARKVSSSAGEDQIIVCCQDNSEARRLSEALNYAENHDSLTGLHNRHYFEKMLGRLSAEAQWNEQGHVLVYMDIDQLKVINDVSGHGAGDQLIRDVAQVLRERVRRSDVLARLGGDEFAIILVDCPLERAHIITDSMRDALAALKFQHEERLYRITASFGMVAITGEDSNVAMTLGKADTACFTAKEAGRNRVHLFEANTGDALRRRGEMEWVSRVNDALENDRFVLFAQGIYDLGDPEAAPGFEILVRLLEGDKIVPPGLFLPAVERFNLSGEVDRRVIEKLLEWSAENPQVLDYVSRWSVNLSGVTMTDSKFAPWLREKFSNSVLPPSKVCFEVTETAAITQLEVAREFIRDMKVLGFNFALDDFGSGLSSFAYLKELPVSTVKIDGIFVRDILESPIHKAMVRSITEISHLMGKRVVGEFVETDEIGALLHSLGVDAGQGYGLGKPQPIDELRKLVRNREPLSAA